jgi:hypothetical protein
MTLSIDDLVRLSRISQNLRRSDPDQTGSRGLADRRRATWRAVSYGVLSVCIFLGLIGLVVGSTTTSVVGGVLLLVGYPVVLLLAEKDKRKSPWPGG